MKREIKFRGKRIDNGEWVYGYYYSFTAAGKLIACIMGIGKDTSTYMVDPETVGQYTGLKDRNGKEIYEGDITKDKRGLVECVVFGDWAFRVKGEKGIYYKHNLYECEVIGNIYDNPDLLEGGYE
jgi:hypothetical protein